MAGSTSTQTTQLNSSPDSSTDSSPNYSSRNSLSAKSSSEKLLDILGTELFKNILAKVNLYLRDPSLFAIRIIGIPGIFKSAFAEAACLKIIKDMSRAQTNEKDKGKEKEQETASTAELKKGEEKERDRVHNITRELSEIITRKELFRETSLSTSSESDKSQIVQVDGVLKKYFLMCEQDKHRLLFLICDDFNYVDPNFWHIARIKHWRPPNCVFVVTANWADVGIYHYPDNLVRRCLTIRMDDGDSDVIVRWGESQDWYEEDKFNSITFNGQGLNDVTAKEVVTYVKTIHERLRKELFRAVTGETKGSNQDPYNPTIGIGFHHFVFEHCQSTKDYVRNLNNRFFDLRLQLQDGCKIPDHLKTVLDEYETKLSEWNSTFEIDDNGDTIDLVHLKEKWEEWNNGPIGKNLRPRNMPCISVSQSSLPQSTRKRKRSLEKTSYPTPITTLASNDRQARDTVRPSAQPEDDLTSIANSSIRPIPATIDYFNFPSAASNGVNMQTTDQEQSTPDEFDQMIDDDDTETNGHSAISENYNTVEFGPVDTGNNMEEMPGDFFNLASEASNGVNIPTDPEQPTLDETDQIIDDDDTETNGDSAIDNNTAEFEPVDTIEIWGSLFKDDSYSEWLKSDMTSIGFKYYPGGKKPKNASILRPNHLIVFFSKEEKTLKVMNVAIVKTGQVDEQTDSEGAKTFHVAVQPLLKVPVSTTLLIMPYFTSTVHHEYIFKPINQNPKHTVTPIKKLTDELNTPLTHAKIFGKTLIQDFLQDVLKNNIGKDNEVPRRIEELLAKIDDKEIVVLDD